MAFGGNEIEDEKFHCYKNPFFKMMQIIDNILSKKISCGEKNYKYFINYMDDYKIKPLRIILLKMSAYGKSCDGETKQIYFSIEDNVLSKTHDDIWNKIVLKQNLIASPSTMKMF